MSHSKTPLFRQDRKNDPQTIKPLIVVTIPEGVIYNPVKENSGPVYQRALDSAKKWLFDMNIRSKIIKSAYRV